MAGNCSQVIINASFCEGAVLSLLFYLFWNISDLSTIQIFLGANIEKMVGPTVPLRPKGRELFGLTESSLRPRYSSHACISHAYGQPIEKLGFGEYNMILLDLSLDFSTIAAAIILQ